MNRFLGRTPAHFLFVVASVCGSASGFAPTDPIAWRASAIGTNLSNVGRITTQWDFTDLMKGSQPIRYNGGGLDNQLVPTDAMGNPLLGSGQSADTLLRVRSDSTQRSPDYPAGSYTITWEGTGDFRLTGGGDNERIVSSGAGTRTYQITQPDDTLYMQIFESDPGDPLRNIRVHMPGYGPGEARDGQRTHETFRERIARPYGNLRLMDWNNVNRSLQTDWSQRTSDGALTYSTESGVPIEEQLRLANEGGGDVWFTMPVAANDAYVRRFARAALYGIDANGVPYTSPQANPHVAPIAADRRVYVEYGNEVWNSLFVGRDYITDQGNANGLNVVGLNGDFAKQWAIEARRDLGIWKTEFDLAGQTERLRRVAAVQTNNTFVSPAFIEEMQVDGVPQFDVLSPTFYVGIGSGYDASSTADDIIDGLYADMASAMDTTSVLHQSAGFSFRAPRGAWAMWKHIADDLGVEMFAYEGGQHVVPNSLSTPWYGAYVEAQRSDRMYDFYTDWYEAIFDTVGTDGVSVFTSVGLISQFGAWGQLESQEQLTADAPKYRAFVDYTRRRGDLTFDGRYDDADIDALRAAFGEQPTGDFAVYDLDGNGVIDQDDTMVLVDGRFETRLGDTDLDGVVELSDIDSLVLNAGQAGGWYDGDFSGDGIVDETDALIWRFNVLTPGLNRGDFNADGVVDAADYTVWRDRKGSRVDLRADANADGVVDSADFDRWRFNFGSRIAAAAIPEPAAAAQTVSAVLAALGLGARGGAYTRVFGRPVRRQMQR